MNDVQVPIDMVTDLLLPQALRAELCITGVQVSGDHELLRFRIDPGSAFQRRGYVRNTDGARFVVGVSERYLPDGPRTEVCGCSGVPAGDVPDQLRTLSGWAYTWDGERDHWYDARPRLTPAWAGSRRSAGGRSVETAVQDIAERAHREHVTHYVYLTPGRLHYANNPPGPDIAFFSVTLRGDWSLHEGRATYPLEQPPDASAVVGLRIGAVRLARTDLRPAEAPVIPLRRAKSAGAKVAASRMHL